MKVSIIIPSYNDGRYVPEALESALAQTYKDIEIVIVDDGSDNTESIEILKKCAEHPSVRLIHTHHVGLPGARNAGIRKAKGKYIMLLDADNKYAPGYVEKAAKIAEENPNVGIVYGDAELFGEKTGHWDLPEFTIETMLINNVIDAAALFRKEDWEQVGGFSENLKYGLEDYDFWLSLIELGKDVYKIPEVLFYYRVRSESMVHSLQRDEKHMQEALEFIHKRHAGLYLQKAYETIKCLTSEKERLEQTEQELNNQRNTLMTECENLKERLMQIEQSYAEISNSTIWKMTKPVRKTLDWIKHIAE